MPSAPKSSRILAPAALLELGNDYAAAAEFLFVHHSPTVIPFVPVPYFLLGHAIELELKAYLSAERVGEKELRDIGHDLLLGLAAARAVGLDALLTPRPAEHQALEMIAQFYGEKELEYSSITAGEGRLVSYPDPVPLRSLAARLYTSIREHCGRRTSEQRSRPGPAEAGPPTAQGETGTER